MLKFIQSGRAALLSAVAVSLALPAGSFAQALEEIIVTAQRRAESLQDVPLAVTALSPQDLEQRQIRNVRDLQASIPNISLATNTGTASGARIFLRGVGEDESRSSADPAIGVYVDGVYLGRQTGGMLDLVDLERVEVLRGPQGTLYGRNSNGGAIKLVSAKPQLDEEDLAVQFTAGNYERFDARITGNFALTDSAAIRATALSKNRDGFHTLKPNGDLAVNTREVGDVEMLGVRAAILQQFNDNWEAIASVDYIDDDSDPVPDSRPGVDVDGDHFTIEPAAGTTCSSRGPALFAPNGCFSGYSSEVNQLGVALSLKGDVGEYSVTSLTGYRSLEDNLASRIGFPYWQETDQEQISQEINLASNYDGPFNFVAGVYYFNEDVTLDSIFVNTFTLGVEATAWAIFGQGTYELIDGLTFTGGLRYTNEDKDLDAANVTRGGGAFSRVEKGSFNNATYKGALDYQFNDDLMAYLSYSTGFKSGGWSPDCFSLSACFLPVKEEEIDTIEVGVRSDWLDGRLRFNAVYFFNMYDGLQIAATVPGLGFTRFNVDETQIHGGEIEFVMQPTDNLELNGNIGWLDAEYDSVSMSQAGGLTNDGAACPGGVATIACALGLELKNAPEFNFGAGGIYRVRLLGNEMSLGLNISFEEETYNLVANPDSSLTDPGLLLDARIAYGDADGKWEVALWGKNLTDREYARASEATTPAVFAAEPLTYGVDLRYSFF